MRCLATDCCSCCLVMAGNWNVVTKVPPWQLWSHRDRISCWCLNLIHWSSLVGFHCSRRFSLSRRQTCCWRQMNCWCCLVAAGISSVFDCWLSWNCCCCRTDCSCCCNCFRQDLWNTIYEWKCRLIRNKELMSSFKASVNFHTLNPSLYSCSWTQTLKL